MHEKHNGRVVEIWEYQNHVISIQFIQNGEKTSISNDRIREPYVRQARWSTNCAIDAYPLKHPDQQEMPAKCQDFCGGLQRTVKYFSAIMYRSEIVQIYAVEC
ncbi:hypothetical protein KIN20_038409 [Parelaphostrongylus tenuis]|uniref:Uncharacterized protein n=1 Tax=Parelaphostrongylus tenuis TaxID=148309 RepID=A0AAD5QQA3_PARTN|nr:hypothetical protein KIN20_038409 [Parelaphostrongylus tenuis]